MDLRNLVLKAMAYRREPLNPSGLAALAGLKTRTVYNFTSGKTPINSDALGRIFDALGLVVVSEADMRLMRSKLKLEAEAKVKEKRPPTGTP